MAKSVYFYFVILKREFSSSFMKLSSSSVDMCSTVAVKKRIPRYFYFSAPPRILRENQC